ncbi:MAG: sigma factor-like helix-turn-helix DNA-binding protein, partial [Kineosporiaceae bacterium]
RVAIVLVDLQGLSVGEAAAVLDVAEGTVKSRCSRGRLALARLFLGQDRPGHGAGGGTAPAGAAAGGNLPVASRVAPAEAPGAAGAPRGGRTQSRGEEGERGHAWTAS